MADALGLMGMAGGAGAGDAVDQIFQQRMEQAQLAQQDALVRLKVQEQAEAMRARLEQSRQFVQERSDTLAARQQTAAAAQQDRQQRLAMNLYPMLPRTGLDAGTVAQQTGAGMPSALFPPTPMQAPAPPAGLAAPDQGSDPQPLPGTVANAPAPAQRTFDRVITPAERTADAATALKASDANAKVQHWTDQTNAAWERLRLQGDNNEARAALARSAAELAQAKLDATIQRGKDSAAKTPQPIFFGDTAGATHAVIFDKGKFQEVPLPKGYVPTKAAPPGFFDRLKGLFEPSSSPTTTDPTDPNWGK